VILAAVVLARWLKTEATRARLPVTSFWRAHAPYRS
jgi:hypothetical protein